MPPSDPETAQKKASPNVKASSARLRAVQALYQKQHNNQPMRAVVAEYINHRSEMSVDGEMLVSPDEMLFKSILFGVEERMPELTSIVDANLKKDSPNREVEPLLTAILLCGAYELLVQKTDAPIVINDYLNVGHAFYDRNEVALINGVLDSIARLFSTES